MREFDLINAQSIEQASVALAAGNAKAVAGGTDIMGALRREIYPDFPETLVDLKTIPGLAAIEETDGLRIGALTRLTDIAENKRVQEAYMALATAARRTASPQIRNMGTIGGNICQEVRCWYFRMEDNAFPCRKKGGKLCYAPAGDHRYHSILGAANGCFAVNPSDTAPALVALCAVIVTNKRRIPAEEFWACGIPGSTVLEPGEIVVSIELPPPRGKSAFVKFAYRGAIDFPIVNCAAWVSGEDVRICLNAVGPVPYRARKAEQAFLGAENLQAGAQAAAEAAVADARPLKGNGYKVDIAKVVVRDALLACKA